MKLDGNCRETFEWGLEREEIKMKKSGDWKEIDDRDKSLKKIVVRREGKGSEGVNELGNAYAASL
jgi:hypothetical protein